MDNRMRDLDQIQEREGDEQGRRLGTILLATAAVVGLTFAIGVVVGRAAEPVQPVDDPLARLTQTMPQAPAVKAAPVELPKIDAADLSFPSTLSDTEDRPEVLAALKAAEAEERALSGEPSLPPAAAPARAAAPVQPAGEDEEAAGDAPVAAQDDEIATDEIVAAIPAAVAGGGGTRTLPKAAKRDKMVAAAIKAADDAPSAPRGHDGEYTLQVISHDRPEPSRAFAEGLRAKGHMAFVVAADIPERGRYYRVRIGPFKNRMQAEEYRRKFEDEEHMNTFVVRTKPED